MKGKPKIIVIVGPTASGKSGLAIRLAQKFNGEIISADSRQVYRGMNIGTGKVSTRELRLIPHHLINVISPKKEFTAADFKSRANRAIADISVRGKLPIIVGGTGFYIDALVYDLSLPDVPPDKRLRAKLEKQTAEQLFAQLKKLDLRRARTIDRHNKHRLIRALEIIRTIGRVPEISKNSDFDVLWIGLNPKDLERRIRIRLDQRLRQGMIREVQKLHKSGISYKRFHDFGLEYRWISEYLKGKLSKTEMKNGLGTAIRQYSKRQMTWFKRNKDIRWIKNLTEATRLGRAFLRFPQPLH